MGLFFAVSGFLAAMTLALWGPSRQIRQRLVRIGIPLTIGMLTIVPLIKVVVLWSANRNASGTVNPEYAWTMANLFGMNPRHLWFLSYLLVLNFIGLLIWVLVRNWPAITGAVESGFRWLASGPLLVPVLALVSSSILWSGGFVEAPGVVASSLFPKAVPLAYYGVFFLLGWMLYRSRDLLPMVEARPLLKLAAGAGWAVLAWLVMSEAITPPAALTGWAVAMVAGLAAWYTIFGVWGLFARLLPDARPWVRYLADASYWMYLIHLPFLLFFEISLTSTSLPPLVRLILATGAALGVSLLTYTLLVRHSPIGRLLHGPRERRPRPPKPPSNAVPPGPQPAEEPA